MRNWHFKPGTDYRVIQRIPHYTGNPNPSGYVSRKGLFREFFEGAVMSKQIATPVVIDYGNGNNKFLVGADHELIFSTDDATESEMEEIKSSINGKAAAVLFMQELLDSVDTLSGIADQHGVHTLADLMYLHSAIMKGSFIDHYPGESKVLQIASALPSGDQWSKFITEVPA